MTDLKKNTAAQAVSFTRTRILHAAGFSYEMADRAWNAIDSHIYGFMLQVLKFPFEPSEYAEAAEAFLPQIAEDHYPSLHALSMQVINGMHFGAQGFCFGLDLILDSLERLHDKNSARSVTEQITPFENQTSRQVARKTG